MKTIGLIGGMSWESTLEYYRIINETVRLRLGGLHSASCVMYSVDFAPIEVLQHSGRWIEAGKHLITAGEHVANGGADFLILCSNTMHKLADQLERHLRIPFIHIADPTASEIQSAGIRKVGLLGTRFTMEEDFYRERLTKKHGMEVLIPELEDRMKIHQVIFNELCMGDIQESSKGEFLRIMGSLILRGATGIILGCTEIGLLITSSDVQVPVFDTTRIHAQAAVDLALEEGSSSIT